MASGETILHVRLHAQEAAGVLNARVAAIVYCLLSFESRSCMIGSQSINLAVPLFAPACVLICFYQDMGPLSTSLPPKKFFGRFCCLLHLLAPGSVLSFMPIDAGSILTFWKIVERAWTCACIKPKPNQKKPSTKANKPNQSNQSLDLCVHALECNRVPCS